MITLLFERSLAAFGTFRPASYRLLLESLEILYACYPQMSCFLLPNSAPTTIERTNLSKAEGERSRSFALRGPLAWLHRISLPLTSPNSCFLCSPGPTLCTKNDKAKLLFTRHLGHLSRHIDLFARAKEAPPYGGDVFTRFVAHMVVPWISEREISALFVGNGNDRYQGVTEETLHAVFGLLEDTLRYMNLWAVFSPYRSGLAVDYPSLLHTIPPSLSVPQNPDGFIQHLSEIDGVAAVDTAVWILLHYTVFICFTLFRRGHEIAVMTRSYLTLESYAHADPHQVEGLHTQLCNWATRQSLGTRLLQALSETNGSTVDSVVSYLWTFGPSADVRGSLRDDKVLYQKGKYRFCTHPLHRPKRDIGTPIYRVQPALAHSLFSSARFTRESSGRWAWAPPNTIKDWRLTMLFSWAERVLKVAELHQIVACPLLREIVVDVVMRAQQLVSERIQWSEGTFVRDCQRGVRTLDSALRTTSVMQLFEPVVIAIMGLIV